MAFLALPLLAAAAYGLYWLMTYEPALPPPPPKIEHFRIGEMFQKEAGGQWTVRVEWDTKNGETITLDPEPGKVDGTGKHTYAITEKLVLTLKVKNASGEAAHEMTLEPSKSQ